VEAALAKALTDASGAGRFDVVILLAKELEARRVAGLNRSAPVDQSTADARGVPRRCPKLSR
jgi:hypothetical protein